MTDSLLCALVYSEPLDRRARGSIIERCTSCNRKVWIAPSGQALIKEKGPTVLCIPCGLAAIKNDPEPTFAPISEEQRQEIRRALSDDA